MSWSSDCAEYCQGVRKKLRNGERVDKIILDSNLMILESLAGIADMMEKIRSERIIIPSVPDSTPSITAVYAAPVYPMNYAYERSEDD